MRPFGSYVTILHTLDHLGKFDGKADEGFFVGYSMNSNTFRVFNSRTRIVKETLHINFLENKSNVIGSGLNWLFDIDTLTKSTDYKPVVTENQSNGSAGEEEKKDAKDPRNQDNKVLSTEEPRVNQKKEANTNNTNNINTVSPTANAASIKDNDVDKNIVYGCANDLNMTNLEEIVYLDDDENVGAEADMTNLDTNIPFSPILTTKLIRIIQLNKSLEIYIQHLKPEGRQRV
nr:ribonuclease H-like domain-containing protein [Tanacetum cinerariifolium]